MCHVFCHSGYNRYVLYKCVECFVIQYTTAMFCINVSSVLSFSVYQIVLYKCVKCFVIQGIAGMFYINVSSVLSFSVQQVCSV